MSRYTAYINSGEQILNPLDLHKELKSGRMEITASGLAVQNSVNEELSQGSMLDITTWLRQAAPHYHISNDIRDFVLVPVVTIPSDLPNRNGVGFPLTSLTEFIPEAGMLSYQTFKGKPTYYEHKNDDITQAKGVIADTHLRRLMGYGQDRVWKLLKLLAYDRSKDEVLATRILSRDPSRRINTYSMGATYTGCYCSYCDQPVDRCHHIDPDPRSVTFYEKDGHVVHRYMTGIVGFETSAVESPAWMVAISDDLVASPVAMDLRMERKT